MLIKQRLALLLHTHECRDNQKVSISLMSLKRVKTSMKLQGKFSIWLLILIVISCMKLNYVGLCSFKYQENYTEAEGEEIFFLVAVNSIKTFHNFKTAFYVRGNF